MTTRPRVLLADDHKAVAVQLRGILATDFEVVATVADGAALIEAAAELCPDVIVTDDRPNVPAGNFFWAGDRGQVGQVLYAYRSLWLPVSLLQKKDRLRLVDALFRSTRHWEMSLHFRDVQFTLAEPVYPFGNTMLVSVPVSVSAKSA